MNKDQLIAEFRSLPALPETAPRFTWLRRRIEIHNHINRDDIGEFLQWSTMREAMFVGDVPYIRVELGQLDDRHWAAIVEPMIGSPDTIIYGTLETSGNLINQAYHLKQWEDTLDCKISEVDSVVEFGGGYGSLALICRRLGFKGHYSIIDFPEFGLLQKYYLSNTIGLEGMSFHSTLEWPDSADLFIGLWSVSEVEERIRKLFIANLQGYNSFLIGYAPRWDAMNNRYWFWRNLIRKRTDIDWHSWYIPHQPNGVYLIG